ncbi:MAG: ATP-dependent helicase [Patescibacteria group bacterium]|nr:ATP-dependent helicase [Patescibacteria group bacterium]
MPINYETELNSEQQKVIYNADGPCLVLAGAGSGKTRTIIYRVAYLLEQGILPENILLLTFTNKAAKEMMGRLGSSAKKIVGGTFHRTANLILRKYAPLVGYKNNFTILDAEDSKDFMNFAIKESSVDTTSKRFPKANVIKNLWSFCRNSMQTLEEVIEKKYPDYYSFSEQMREVINIYEDKKRKSNSMDFDDLLINLLTLLRTLPDIRERLSNRFKYILVDEYQDTNKIQAEMIYHLASHHKNILVVGDDAQSIYSFRAAEIKNILDFQKIYPEAKIFRLETNYRSTPDILDFANSVISFNFNQFPKNLKSFRQQFIKPQYVPVASAEEEANYIVDEILRLHDEGVDLKKMAVLFRAAFHSQALEMELVKRNIPYDYRGGVRFFERAHIKDILALLRISYNIRDDVAWYRILTKQRGIGKITADKILSQTYSAENLKQVLELNINATLSPKAQVGWGDFVSMMHPIESTKEKTVSALIKSIIKSGYEDFLKTEYLDAKDRLEDIEGLSLFAKKYKDLGTFLAESSLQENFAMKQETAPSNEDRLILSTIHQAKGLEWNTVFVINLTDMSLPHRRAVLEEGGEEEERRLFYVAITRAKDQLFLTYPITGGFDSVYLNNPSRFIENIPDNLLERVEIESGEVLPIIEI